MMNNLLFTQDQEQQSQQSLHIPAPSASRIRPHSLKPQHSRLDYARRKSAADITTIVPSFEPSTDEKDLVEDDILGPPRRSSASWFKRRFTLFSLEQPVDEKRRMTTDRFSFCVDRSCADILKQKRPSVIAQMLEVV
jgi:hypothetical protein